MSTEFVVIIILGALLYALLEYFSWRGFLVVCFLMFQGCGESGSCISEHRSGYLDLCSTNLDFYIPLDTICGDLDTPQQCDPAKHCGLWYEGFVSGDYCVL